MAIEDYYSAVELEPELDSNPQVACDKCGSVQYADFLIPTSATSLICESCFEDLDLEDEDIYID